MLEFEKLTFEKIDQTVQMMQDFYAIDGYEMDEDISRNNFRQFIEQENLGQCWLIKDNEQVMGYMILVYFFSFEFKGKVAILDELYLNAHARGRGIGKKAVQFIQDYAQQTAVKLIFLEVEEHNEAAKKLYSNQGFGFHPRKIMRYSIENN